MFRQLTGTCYRIRNIINDKSYVGSSIRFMIRKKEHIRDLIEGNHHSSKLQNAWNKYGIDSFEWEVLEIIDNIDNLNPCEFRKVLLDRETCYITRYDSVINGYNICLIAGSPLGLKRSDEFSRVMSKIKRTWYDSNPNIASQHSEDLKIYWGDLENRKAQSNRKKKFYDSNPHVAIEHGIVMKQYYEQHPEARDEMRNKKFQFHKDNPKAAEDARERAINQFSKPGAKEAASRKTLAFYNSPEKVSKREERDGVIKIKLLEGISIRKIAIELHTTTQIVGSIRKLLMSEGLIQKDNKYHKKTNRTI